MIASLWQRPAALFRQWSDRWLRRRIPRTRGLTLNQRRIFILPTRDGMGFLLMLTAIFIGGINYANSLILGVAFLLVSVFLVSILHTYANLSGLRISAGRSENAFAGEEAVFWVTLSSGSPVDVDSTAVSGREHESIRLCWGTATPQMVDLIESHEVAVRMLLPVAERGVYHPPRLKVETWFPLGLLTAWSVIELDMSCLVYPRPRESELPARGDVSAMPGEQRRPRGSDDFDGLKPYVPGDHPRHIAWKNYARTGELYAKQFIARDEHERWLDWYAFGGFGVEERLSRLCYWVVRYGDEGRSFGLKLPALEIAPGSGELQVKRCLEQLARYGLSETDASV